MLYVYIDEELPLNQNLGHSWIELPGKDKKDNIADDVKTSTKVETKKSLEKTKNKYVILYKGRCVNHNINEVYNHLNHNKQVARATQASRPGMQIIIKNP